MSARLVAVGALVVLGTGVAYMGACQGSDALPLADSGATADAKGPKDAGFLDLDAGPGPDAASTVPSVFRGDWDPLPGLEAYPVWTARNPAASATALHWKPCTPATAGCEELDVDWTSERLTERLKAYSNESTPFYKQEGRSFFIYQREFPMAEGSSTTFGRQTVVEEIGVGIRFVLGEAPPFSSGTVATLGGGVIGLSSLPRATRRAHQYAYNVDTNSWDHAEWDLAPFGIPEDDLGIPMSYGTHFSHVSGTVPRTTLSDVRAKTMFGIPERRDWVNQKPRADGLFAINQGLNRIDFIDWTGKVSSLHTPSAGWDLYGIKLDRDSNTLIWFELNHSNLGRGNLYASPANAATLTPRLVRAIDLGDPNKYPSPAVMNGDFIAYGISQNETEVVRMSTGETRRVTIPAPARGGFQPWYVDENVIWEPEVAGYGMTTMFRVNWKNAPIVP